MRKIYIFKNGEDLREVNSLPKTLKADNKTILGFDKLPDIELRNYNYFPAFIDIPAITEYQKLGIKQTIWREETQDYLIKRNVVNKTEQEIEEMINIEKQRKINEIKQNGENIIFTKYPLYKQQNMTAEQQYAVHAIVQLEKIYNSIDINSDAVIYNATMKIGMTDTIPELNTLENNLPSVDDLSTQEDIKKYYDDIIYSIIAFRKIRLVRNLINQKMEEVNMLSILDDIKAYNVDFSEIIEF